jgi:hypothetical protein
MIKYALASHHRLFRKYDDQYYKNNPNGSTKRTRFMENIPSFLSLFGGSLVTPSLPSKKESYRPKATRPNPLERTNAAFRSSPWCWSIDRWSRLSTLALWQIARMPIDGKTEYVSRSCSRLVSVRSLDHNRNAIRQ